MVSVIRCGIRDITFFIHITYLIIYLLCGPSSIHTYPENNSQRNLRLVLQGCGPQCRIDLQQNYASEKYWRWGTLWALLSEPQQAEHSQWLGHMGMQLLWTSLPLSHCSPHDSTVRLWFHNKYPWDCLERRKIHKLWFSFDTMEWI